jgi:flagellar protein FlgJ
MNLHTMAAGPVTANADTVALQRHLKLQDAAEKFEGMMLQELLKPMQEGKDGSGGGFGFGNADRDDSLDTFSSFGTEAVANAIAKAGGVGIAKQVMREVGALDTYNGGDKFSDKRGIHGYNGSLQSQNGSLDGKVKKKS